MTLREMTISTDVFNPAVQAMPDEGDFIWFCAGKVYIIMIFNRFVNEIPADKNELKRGEFISVSYDAACKRIKEQNREEKKDK